MIIRFFRAVIRDGEQEAFKSFFFRTALPFVRSQKGLESVTIGLPHASTPYEFSMLTRVARSERAERVRRRELARGGDPSRRSTFAQRDACPSL